MDLDELMRWVAIIVLVAIFAAGMTQCGIRDNQHALDMAKAGYVWQPAENGGKYVRVPTPPECK